MRTSFGEPKRATGAAHAFFAGRNEVGIIKQNLDDFLVDEIPLYPPSGTGTHTYVRFAKRGLATRDAVDAFAAHLDVNPRDVGVPGLKDKYATTTQWISFEHIKREVLADFQHPQIEILEVTQHGNKLRTGHLLANRFSIKVTGLGIGDAACPLISDFATLVANGLPNYYGVQRFGAQNLEQAARWVDAGMPRTKDPKFLVSVLQSAWFNEALLRRVQDGSYASVIDGDLVRKEETGGMFVVNELELDRARAASFEITATGPMFGDEMRWPERAALAFEQEVLAHAEVSSETLAKLKRFGAGTRRPYRVRVQADELAIEQVSDGFWLRFSLSSGSYATTVLDELMPWSEPQRARKPAANAELPSAESPSAESPSAESPSA